jgi:glycosyltransferase involved in cell wall biosynthesis
MTTPLVSIVMPVYKAEKYIADTLKSALNQTYSNFELIVVDDESPDRSIEICQQMNDPRIRILHQKNQGPAGARNNGVRNAKGDFIAFLDADDLWLPEKLEKHLAHLKQTPEVGVSFCRSAFIDEESKPLGIYQLPQLKDITPRYVLCRNPVGNGSVPVIRRQVFEDIKFRAAVNGEEKELYFDESLRGSEDSECWLRIALTTQWKLEGIPEALTCYRVNSSGLSANVEKMQRDLERSIEKTRLYAPQIDQWANAARAYQLRYLARRAVTLRDGKTAVGYMNQALSLFPGILVEEPRRTGMTIAAAYLLRLLPQSLYRQFEALALKVTGANQRRRISQEEAHVS